MTGIRFEGLMVENIKKGFAIIGDENSIADATFVNDENANPEAFGVERTKIDTKYLFDLKKFDEPTPKNVASKRGNARPLLDISDGNLLVWKIVDFSPRTNQRPFGVRNIGKVVKW